MNVRSSLVIFTVIVCGGLVGSGVVQLAAAQALPLRPSPALELPRPIPIPRGRAPIIAPEARADEGSPAPPAACPAYRLAGVFLVRGARERSLAAIHTAAGASLVAPSMTVEGWTIEAIEPDRLLLVDAGGQACDVRAAEDPARIAAPPDEMVVEIAPRHYRIARGSFDASALGLRAIPDAQGVRIYGVRAGSLAARAGLRNGDRVTAIDGRAPVTAEAALEAYGRALAGARVRITIARAGASLELVYELAP